MIELQSIVKDFNVKGGNVHAVRDVSIKIDDGEIFGIIGFSGAGKSTLVRCINLLEKPTSIKTLVDTLQAALTAKPSIELSPSRPTQSPTQPVAGENQEEKLLVSLRNRIDFSLPLREARDQFERAYFSYLLEKENYSMTE